MEESKWCDHRDDAWEQDARVRSRWVSRGDGVARAEPGAGRKVEPVLAGDVDRAVSFQLRFAVCRKVQLGESSRGGSVAHLHAVLRMAARAQHPVLFRSRTRGGGWFQGTHG